MSKILRRPMFRGGPVNSRGTGITSGLDDSGYADGGRVGYKTGGNYFTDTQFGRVLSDVGLAGRGILSDLYNVAGVPTNIATEFLTGYNPGFSGERIFGLEGKRDPLRFSTFEPGKSKFFGYNTSSVPGRTYTEDMYKDATQRGLDITREKPFEVSDEATMIKKPNEPSGKVNNIPRELTEEEEITKQAKLYQKLLGGDEAKSQSIYDALLAASPAFFKGKNLREATPQVFEAINKSGAFDKPRDIKQAASQLAIQRAMLKDKAVAEERSRLAIYGAKNQETLSETLKNIPGSFIAGPLPEGFKENTNLLRPGGIYSVGNEKFYAVPGDIVDSSGKKKPGVVGLQKL
jgi:hypothetical protein